jgi:Tfp pilus assembly protein PilO
MKSFFDKLTPAERRLVVIVGIGVFVVINIWFIIPTFGQYGQLEDKRTKTLKQIADYKIEITRRGTYEKLIKELSSLGSEVASESQALKLVDEVNTHIALSGITVGRISPLSRSSSYGGKTNAFFEEASVNVDFIAGEKELIDFLYRLADKQFLIRAKSLTVQPDVPGRMKLQGSITLVKSYQRKPPPKAIPTPPKNAPATNTAPKPTAPKTAPATKPGPAPTNAVVTPPKK